MEPEFAPIALQDRVVWGAAEHDPVRLHGAITAALNLYPRGFAYAHVFAPALDRLDADAWSRARTAMNLHLLDARQNATVYRRPGSRPAAYT